MSPEDVDLAVRCPVDWVSLFGSVDAYPDALDLLHREWVRCVRTNCMSSEEALFVDNRVRDRGLSLEPEPALIRNLKDRRTVASAMYMSGAGRLAALQFLRPSEHGKHFALGKSAPTNNKQSFFYKDLQASTLFALFSGWFDDAFLLDPCFKASDYRFARDVSLLWRKLTSNAQARVAVDVVLPIGHAHGEELHHIAIDVDVGAGVAHGYPITSAEAASIMAPAEVRPMKPIEATR